MSASITSRTIEIPAGSTIACDLRCVVYPVGYSVRLSSGNITRKASNGDRPGNKYLSPNSDVTVASPGKLLTEVEPVAWLQFANGTSNSAWIDFSCNGVDTIVIHDSAVDDIAALSVPAQNIGVGENVTFLANELFSYGKGAADLTATSSSNTNARAFADPDTGEVRIQGVASGSANVTVTATTPTEETASVTIAVTVA